MNRLASTLDLTDQRPGSDDILIDVCAGLRRQPKRLSSKYFYDAQGSALFERICAQPEYYLTRAELALMDAHVVDIAATLGPDVLLIEYGSGSGIKTRMLLQHLQTPVAYVPIEISSAALAASVARLETDFPRVEMLPVCSDFTQSLSTPAPMRGPRRTVVYFPGSTIGNFETSAAVTVLRHMHQTMGPHGAALVGVDLVKQPAIMDAAYNDAAGVTAAFTLNMLARFNRELDADFQLDLFAHRAQYNAMAERIETFIVSRIAQDVHIAGQAFRFVAGESMLVEFSCKYSPQSFARLAAKAGLCIERTWSDPQDLFNVHCLVAAT